MQAVAQKNKNILKNDKYAYVDIKKVVIPVSFFVISLNMQSVAL